LAIHLIRHAWHNGRGRHSQQCTGTVAVVDSRLVKALSAPAHQRQLQTVNRLLPEPAAVTVPVQVSGATWWSFIGFAASTIGAIWVMVACGENSVFVPPLAAVCPLVVPILAWPANVLLRSRTRPLRLPWGALLAVNPHTVAVVSISPWSWAVSRGGTVKAIWPRHQVVVEVAPLRRFGVRKLAVRPLGGITIHLEAVISARWVDPVLTDLA
jgi:hypothetical protein